MKNAKHLLVLFVLVLFIAFVALAAFMGFGGKGEKTSVRNIHLGLDLAGGVSITYQAKEGSNPSVEEMNGALSVIQRRLDSKGYTEASAYIDGTDRIRVEIPGVENATEAVDEIGRTAMLRFVGVDLTSLLASDFMDAYYQKYADEVRVTLPQDSEITDEELLSEAKTFFSMYESEALAQFPEIFDDAIEQGLMELIVTGVNVNNATYQKGQTSSSGAIEAYVKLDFDAEGTRLFAEGTQKYLNKQIAILLDDTVCSMPMVSAVISDGTAIISGIRSDEEARNLASDIVGGALPVELVDIEHNSVGATLGQNALSSGILAGLIGFAFIVLFMIFIYRVPGLSASIALVFYVSAELLLFNLLGWTLTLPGIAGFILSIGMAVDANVIVFARIREELDAGKTIRVSVKTGFNKALSAIIDGNITTLIAAIVLYLFGSGTIRGFAQTLGLGIILSMISSLLVTRLLLNSFVAILPDNKKLYESLKIVKTREEVA